MSKVIMVTGGSRSGKSVIAEQKAKEYGKRSVLYLATAIPIDDDMKERIRMHQERRDPEWGTYEGYRDLGEIVKNTEKNTILLDCVTVMITNILFEEEERDFDKISASEVESPAPLNEMAENGKPLSFPKIRKNSKGKRRRRGGWEQPRSL